MSRTVLRWIGVAWAVVIFALGLGLVFAKTDAIALGSPAIWVLVYWVVVGSLSAAIFIAIRRKLAPGWVRSRREEVLAEVKQAKLLIIDAVRPVGSITDGYAKELLDRFPAIESQIAEITGSELDQEDARLDALEKEARWIAQRRAYLLPAYTLDIEAADKISEMKAWGVPAEALAGIEDQIAKLGESTRSLRTALAAAVAKLDATERTQIEKGVAAALTMAAGDDQKQALAVLLESLGQLRTENQAVADELHALIQSLDDEENTRRTLLEKVYENHEYWDWYTDWYLQTAATTVSVALGGVSLATLALALLSLFRWHYLPLGLVLAGASGATLSVLTKLPPLSVFGEVAGSFLRIGSRVVGGTIGSIVGVALLGSGIINVGLPTSGTDAFRSMGEIIDSCSSDCSGEPGVRPAGDPSGAGAASTLTIEAGVAPTASVVRSLSAQADAGRVSTFDADAAVDAVSSDAAPDARLAGKPSDGKTQAIAADAGVAKAPSAAGPAVDAPPRGRAPVPCTTSMVLLLIALGILFGFSERAIPSFENVVMKAIPAPGTAAK